MDDQLKDKYFKFLSKFFSENPKMLEHLERVPIFGERIKQRSKEAWEEGREEGRTLALQESILDALNVRFGLTNGSIARAMHAIDEPQKLRAIFRRIVKAESLEAVKKLLAAEKQSAKEKVRSRATR